MSSALPTVATRPRLKPERVALEVSPLVAAVHEVVDACEVDELLEFQLGRITQHRADFDELRRFDFVHDLVRQRSGTPHARPPRAASTFAASTSDSCGQDLLPKINASDRAGALDLLLQLDDPVRPALPPWADSPARKHPPARCDRTLARPHRNSGNSRRRWRTTPSR